MIKFRKAAFLAGAGAILAIPAFASADFSWDFTTVVSGDTPSGTSPWANLTGTGNGSGGTDFVLTFIGTNGADSSEFLKQLDIAYSGDTSGSSISTSDTRVTGTSVGSFVDAGGTFNFKLDFNTANNMPRVNPGDVVDFTINNSDVNDFTTALLHINNTPGPEGSGKVAPGPVPEPASMAALGIGALGLLGRRRRNRK